MFGSLLQQERFRLTIIDGFAMETFVGVRRLRRGLWVSRRARKDEASLWKGPLPAVAYYPA